jgi:hypothetical protein
LRIDANITHTNILDIYLILLWRKKKAHKKMRFSDHARNPQIINTILKSVNASATFCTTKNSF